ncbi:MAG: RNA ligase family protein [Chloracidobacterium sp.]|nr:RNA ligase family protein [Chloracidobacterium sp.]
MAEQLYKYPRTPHIEGSRFQPGDDDLDCAPFVDLRGKYIVVEEKLDGSNAGVSFSGEGRLLLQSRGHFLNGGPRERQFALFKTWATTHQRILWEALKDRYTLYGEWLYAKHTIFYDALPHYFFEFDLLDTGTGEFLSTDRRRELLREAPVVSAPVLWRGLARSVEHLQSLVTRSLYKTGAWRNRLLAGAQLRGLDVELILDQTDSSDLSEGLYFKVEAEGRVVERYKYVRASFLQAVSDSGSHWMDRPIIPNQLRGDCDLFGSVQ